jgi:hypothetical protein
MPSDAVPKPTGLTGEALGLLLGIRFFLAMKAGGGNCVRL